MHWCSNWRAILANIVITTLLSTSVLGLFHICERRTCKAHYMRKVGYFKITCSDGSFGVHANQERKTAYKLKKISFQPATFFSHLGINRSVVYSSWNFDSVFLTRGFNLDGGDFICNYLQSDIVGNWLPHQVKFFQIYVFFIVSGYCQDS